MNILISGGGTGGHIFPALAVANELRRQWPDAKFLYVGAIGRMEMERVPAAGYEIVGLPVQGFDRKRLWRNIAIAWKLHKAMSMARRIVKEFRPDVAIGTGGYASGPVLKAAQKAGIPTVIVEPNSYAGVTNKLLAAKCSAVCCAYPDMERFFDANKICLTGNPIRADLINPDLSMPTARQRLDFDAVRPLLLVVGGSLGARTINQAIAAALPTLVDAGVQVLWQTGKYYIEEYQHLQEKYKGVKITAFITDMGAAYKAADLIVSRAGAGSIAEIEILGKASILVPSPNVAEDHQRKNAEALAKRGAASMLLDADANAQLGSEILRLLKRPDICNEMAAKAREMALPDAAAKIAAKVVNLINPA